MASEDSKKRKCFTFIWKLENVSYCLQPEEEYFASPTFVVDELDVTNWVLYISFNEYEDFICMGLGRRDENEDAEVVEIDFEFAFLSSDGRVLHSWEENNTVIEGRDWVQCSDFISRNALLFERRSDFLPLDTLTVRCRIWKSVGELSKDVQCFARSRIAVEKQSFLWNIENFSSLQSCVTRTYEIRSMSSDEALMSLKLFFTGGRICDEIIRVKGIPNFQNTKVATIKLSVLDVFKNTVECFHDEFWHEDEGARDECNQSNTLFQTKRELLENKSTYLSNDVLSLWCECAFSSKTVSEEIEMVNSDCSERESDNHSLNESNGVPLSLCILVDNLISMLNDGCLSDVKLKTKSRTYDAHRFILGARSPVFKAMFSNNMREKIKGCVDIEDLNDDTIMRMLRYVYGAEIEELDWDGATELYEAADKYEIIDLKGICSSYLKRHLCADNACEALVLADLHQDEDLKGSLQDYILRHGKDILNSEAWHQLIETNCKLAAKTMHLKFKE